MDSPGTSSDLLREFLADRDAPCPSCQYNLRALTGTRCPECNQELKLQVGLAEPRLAWFVAGIVGIGMPLGFCALLLAWVMAMLVFRTRGGLPPLHDLIPLLLGTVVGGVALAWWVRARPRFNSRSAGARWAAAAACSGVSIICPLWFFAIAR